jgi:hypothetical protein
MSFTVNATGALYNNKHIFMLDIAPEADGSLKIKRFQELLDTKAALGHSDLFTPAASKA